MMTPPEVLDEARRLEQCVDLLTGERDLLRIRVADLELELAEALQLAADNFAEAERRNKMAAGRSLALHEALSQVLQSDAARDAALSQVRQLECQVSKLEAERDKLRDLLRRMSSRCDVHLDDSLDDCLLDDVDAVLGEEVPT